MKLNNIVRSLDSPFKPSCRGVETALIGLGSASLGLMSTQMSNDANRQINKKSMDFSAAEAEKQRQWQSDEWSRQYAIQRDEWYNQLNAYQQAQWQQYLKQAEYNSPVNQVARLKQAGLNPSAVLGGSGSSGLVSAATGNMSSVGSPSVPTGGTVSGASASMPSQIPMQGYQTGILQSMGSVLKDLASASKDNMLTSPMVAYIGSQLVGQNLKNEWQQFENEVMSQVKDTRVKQAFQDLQNSFADYALKSAMSENYSADTLLKDAERALKIAQKYCTDEQFKEISFRVAHQFETWQLDQQLKQSQKVNNYASANYSNALATTEDKLRDFKVTHAELINGYQGIVNDIAANEWKVSDATVEQKIKTVSTQLIEQAKREGVLTSQAISAAEKAVKENDWWLFTNIFAPMFNSQMDRSASAVGSVVRAVK